MSQIKFSCTHCGQHLECADQHSGTQIQCPSCKKKTTVPAAADKANPVLQKSGMTFVPESWNKPTPPAGAKPGE